jgi:hypothetical protein
VLESAGGGAAVPLLDESGGGLVDGFDWSAGGVLCIEFEDELESGAAGAVLEESEGAALGAADCCFEQATIASALKHTKRRLRFIRSPHCVAVHLAVRPSRATHGAGGTQRLVASRVPSQHLRPPVSSRLRPLHAPLICCELSRCFWGK